VKPAHEAEAFVGVSTSMVESPSRECLPAIANMAASFTEPPDQIESVSTKDIVSSAPRLSEDLPPSRRLLQTASEPPSQPSAEWPGTGHLIGWNDPGTRSRIVTPGSD